jgi:hypothetical protein
MCKERYNGSNRVIHLNGPCPCRPTCRGSGPSMACHNGPCRPDASLCGPGRAWAGPNRVVPRADRLAQPICPSIPQRFRVGTRIRKNRRNQPQYILLATSPGPATCRLPAWPRRLAQSRSRAVHPVRARRAAPRILTPYGTRHHTAPLNQPTPREATGARGPHAPPARSAVRSHPTRHALHARVDWFASTAAPRRFASPSPAAAAFIPPCCAFASARAPPAPTRKRNTRREKKTIPQSPRAEERSPAPNPPPDPARSR